MKSFRNKRTTRLISALLFCGIALCACTGGGNNTETSVPLSSDTSKESDGTTADDTADRVLSGFYPVFQDNEEITEMREKLIQAVEKRISDETPPFSLRLDGAAEETGTWTKDVQKTTAANGDLIFTAVYKNSAKGLEATLTGTVFADSPTCDWVMRLKNISEKNSPVVSSLYGLDLMLDLPRSAGSKYVLNTTQGCGVQGTEDYDDFALETHSLTSHIRTFEPYKGRSSDEAWPFFDVLGENCGILLAIGWSGQWKAKFCEKDGMLAIQSGMANLNTYLLPGEEIRTPSYSITYFDGSPEYGHNLFRRLILKHYTPDTGTPDVCRLPLSLCSLTDRTEEAFKKAVTDARQAGVPTDMLVLDAGWYTDAVPNASGFTTITVDMWYKQVGNWSFNKLLFPNGNAKSLSFVAERNGIGLSLWLEPERGMADTEMVNNHRDYYYSRNAGDVYMLNLGNADAKAWLTAYISQLIEENGLKIYRQDYNMTPEFFWETENGADRLGIAEIRHIEGLYEVFDAIRTKYPQVLIDSCASGGRRIDIEMLKRSVILWRTDYCCNTYGENFFEEGTQFQMQSLSYWLPLHATGVGTGEFESYSFRSALAAGINFDSNINTPEKAEAAKALVTQAAKMRPYYYGDYYQILDPVYDFRSWQAYEVYRNDMNEGALVVYVREKSNISEMTLLLKGLDADKTYEITDSDGIAATVTASGSQLMESGYTVRAEKRSAHIYYIRAVTE